MFFYRNFPHNKISPSEDNCSVSFHVFCGGAKKNLFKTRAVSKENKLAEAGDALKNILHKRMKKSLRGFFRA